MIYLTPATPAAAAAPTPITAGITLPPPLEDDVDDVLGSLSILITSNSLPGPVFPVGRSVVVLLSTVPLSEVNVLSGPACGEVLLKFPELLVAPDDDGLLVFTFAFDGGVFCGCCGVDGVLFVLLLDAGGGV